MPRARVSFGLLTSHNQGGGNKKQGLPPTVGLGHFSYNVIQQRGGYCPCPSILADDNNNNNNNKCSLKEVDGGTFNTNAQLERLRGCTKINGDLIIGEFEGQPDFSVFDCLEEITRDLTVGFLIADVRNSLITTITGFTKLKKIGGGLFIGCNGFLTTIPSFSSLITIGKDLTIDVNFSLRTINGFTSLVTIGGGIGIERNDSLTTISGFTSLLTIGSGFYISAGALTSLPDFKSLTTIGKDLYIINTALTSLPDFKSLQFVGRELIITYNFALETISGFENLIEIGGYFEIINKTEDATPIVNAKLKSISGFNKLRKVVGKFNISYHILLHLLTFKTPINFLFLFLN